MNRFDNFSKLKFKMKTKIVIALFFVTMNLTIGYAQDKSRKEIRKERQDKNVKRIDSLINTKAFVFVGKTAMSQDFPNVDITTNRNYLSFKLDTIKSEMPFFGRAFGNVGYGGNDSGMHFEGKPKKYAIDKTTKGYVIKAVVRGINDEFKLYMTVSFEGYANLIINSNNRSSISYYGEIRPQEKNK